jgi:hypothetical protein
MSRIVKIILAANLIALAILVFVYPQLMVAPGKLIPGHKQLEADCFACHTPLLGASSELCISCHKPADIGRLTTRRPADHQAAHHDPLPPETRHSGLRRLP